ncbi:V-type ATP synthase subunit D [Candidatus Parvarchaeota archaeon]|nr:V-type ATP synthase subunit D [Candidatus Parvarchaeota archaeon]
MEAKTTASELIKTKKRIALASRGLELLKVKRSSLIKEFLELARKTEAMKQDMQSVLRLSIETVQIAELFTGRINLERIAAEETEFKSSVVGRNVMGLRLPQVESIKTSPEDRESALMPSTVFDAKKMNTKLLKLVLEVSIQESQMRTILSEIFKLRRRSNSIENVVIPSLKAVSDYIKQRLDDMERDRTSSLKFIKGRLVGSGQEQS